MPMTSPLRVLSLGAGVQSTTLALMILDGLLPPIDTAIFADTHREPESVYKHLWWLAERFHDSAVPLLIVTYRDLGTEALAVERRSGGLPVFIRNADGSKGLARRQCTSDFKIEPITRKVKELMKEAGADRCEQLMGISLDEVRRMRHHRLAPKITNIYPLIDLGMSRWDCQRWMSAKGYSAPRSACYFCPYHSDDEWRRLRDEEPREFAKAVKFERELQAAHRAEHPNAFKGTPFLHRTMVPLDEVDLTTAEDHGQQSMFDSECAGVCGV